jgi:predicted nuclease with TOPRIM domain
MEDATLKKFDKFRMEVRADFELTWGLQADMSKQLDGIGHGFGDMKKTVDEMNETLVGLSVTVEKLHTNVHKLQQNVESLEVHNQGLSETSRKIQGHLKHSADRFDKILEAVSDEFAPRTELLNLEARMETRLAEIERRLSA